VVAVLIANDMSPTNNYSLFAGFIHLGAGLSTGLSEMAAGYAIGVVGDACVSSYLFQPKIFVGMVLILIFPEVIGLFGLIVSLILNTQATSNINRYYFLKYFARMTDISRTPIKNTTNPKIIMNDSI
jgi:V-type H+-transporting ATPase 16kDa proteolipid subunit